MTGKSCKKSTLFPNWKLFWIIIKWLILNWYLWYFVVKTFSFVNDCICLCVGKHKFYVEKIFCSNFEVNISKKISFISFESSWFFAISVTWQCLSSKLNCMNNEMSRSDRCACVMAMPYIIKATLHCISSLSSFFFSARRILRQNEKRKR